MANFCQLVNGVSDGSLLWIFVVNEEKPWKALKIQTFEYAANNLKETFLPNNKNNAASKNYIIKY